MTNTRVTRNDAASRYEIHISEGDDAAAETLAGYAEFQQDGDKIRFTHTEVDPAFRGRGLGDVLADDALSDVAKRGDTIVPLCPFIAKYLSENEVSGAVVQWPHGTPQDAATPPESPA